MSAREPEAFICEDCGALVPVEDAEGVGPLYECGDCGTRYTRGTSADGESHRCPDCNKFGAKVADVGCPDCEEGELAPLYREATP